MTFNGGFPDKTIGGYDLKSPSAWRFQGRRLREEKNSTALRACKGWFCEFFYNGWGLPHETAPVTVPAVPIWNHARSADIFSHLRLRGSTSVLLTWTGSQPRVSPAEARLSQENKRPAGSPVHVVCLLAVVLLLLLLRSRPPSAVPASAPATEFSGERARQVLKRLIGDGIPHPSGSQQNEVVRGRLIEELKNAGYDSSIQSGFSCDDMATAERSRTSSPGWRDRDGRLVLLAAHYDSVAAGPARPMTA